MPWIRRFLRQSIQIRNCVLFDTMRSLLGSFSNGFLGILPIDSNGNVWQTQDVAGLRGGYYFPSSEHFKSNMFILHVWTSRRKSSERIEISGFLIPAASKHLWLIGYERLSITCRIAVSISSSFYLRRSVEFCQSGFNRLEKRNLILNIHCLFMRIAIERPGKAPLLHQQTSFSVVQTKNVFFCARMRKAFSSFFPPTTIIHCGLQIANIAPLNVIEQAIEYIISVKSLIINTSKNQEIIRWK